eukprot:162988-Pelagomonas_calceolata.AAC.3
MGFLPRFFTFCSFVPRFDLNCSCGHGFGCNAWRMRHTLDVKQTPRPRHQSKDGTQTEQFAWLLHSTRISREHRSTAGESSVDNFCLLQPAVEYHSRAAQHFANDT